jgi:hypothetical protein
VITCNFIVCHREIGRAKGLAAWIAELGGVKGFECILCLTRPAWRIGAENDIKPILERAFGSVSTFVPGDEVIEVPWPNDKADARSPNHMFRRVGQEMENNRKKPWLWMEMDAIPVKPSWMTELDLEYERCAKPFMGVKLELGGRPYMSGVSIYPANITRCTPHLWNCPPNQLGGIVPFDVNGGIDTTRMGHFTDLIQYVRANPNPGQEADWSVSHDAIDPRAVLFHRSKDLSLIDHIRGTPAPSPSPVPPEPTPKAITGFETHPRAYISPDSCRGIPVSLHLNQIARYHVMALEGLASSAERRSDIVGMLEISGLTAKTPCPPADKPETITGIGFKMYPKVPVTNRLFKPKKKKRRQMSPEAKAKCSENLAKARAARKAKQLAMV